MLEYVPEGSLANFNFLELLSTADKVSIAIQALDGLIYTHARGFTHG